MKRKKVEGITLPWMNKIRQMNKEGESAIQIIAKLYMYGLIEEERITKAFKKERRKYE